MQVQVAEAERTPQALFHPHDDCPGLCLGHHGHDCDPPDDLIHVRDEPDPDDDHENGASVHAIDRLHCFRSNHHMPYVEDQTRILEVDVDQKVVAREAGVGDQKVVGGRASGEEAVGTADEVLFREVHDGGHEAQKVDHGIRTVGVLTEDHGGRTEVEGHV